MDRLFIVAGPADKCCFASEEYSKSQGFGQVQAMVLFRKGVIVLLLLVVVVCSYEKKKWMRSRLGGSMRLT